MTTRRQSCRSGETKVQQACQCVLLVVMDGASQRALARQSLRSSSIRAPNSLCSPQCTPAQVFLEGRGDLDETIFRFCLVTAGSQQATLTATLDPFSNRPGKDDTRFWKPLKVACESPPSWLGEGTAKLGIQVSDPEQKLMEVPQHLTIEPIFTQQTARLGACLGPLFSASPTMHDWMYYHRDMQISEFHIYVPHGRFIDAANYSREAGSHPAKGLRSSARATTFYSSTVTWHHYRPRPLSYYFGQMITYNECIFRNRHRYEYLVLMDSDEFLVLAEGTLLQLLDRELTATVAGVVFPISWHTVSCPKRNGLQVYKGYDPFASKTPDMTYFNNKDPKEWYGGAKSIVRPGNVITQHVHMPLTGTVSVTELEKRIPPVLAAMKHVRCGSWASTA